LTPYPWQSIVKKRHFIEDCPFRKNSGLSYGSDTSPVRIHQFRETVIEIGVTLAEISIVALRGSQVLDALTVVGMSFIGDKIPGHSEGQAWAVMGGTKVS
jgi:hypothetical protein